MAGSRLTQLLVMQITGALARRLWPPLRGWQLALTLMTAGCVALEILREDDHPLPLRLGTLSYYAGAPTVIGLVGALVLLWYAPTAGAILLATCAVAAASIPDVASFPAIWAVIALGACALLVRVVAARISAAAIRPPMGRVEGEIAGTLADRGRTWGAALTVGALVAGITLVVVHHLFLAEALAFHERAQHHVVEVLKVPARSLGSRGARVAAGASAPPTPFCPLSPLRRPTPPGRRHRLPHPRRCELARRAPRRPRGTRRIRRA